MPIYEYECQSHGTFEELCPSTQRDAPLRCPQCNEPSRRRMSSPRLCGLPRAVMEAHARNERSRHEPRVQHRHEGCTQAHRPSTQPSQQRGGPGYVYSGPRPWVIEHG